MHAAKVAFAKYFLCKMKAGTIEHVSERTVMRALGIRELKRPVKGAKS